MGIILEFHRSPGKPLLRGNDHYWQVMLDLDLKGPWSIHDIHLRSNGNKRSTIKAFVTRLVRGKIAAETGETIKHHNRPAAMYRLLKRPLATPSLADDGRPTPFGRRQRQMWNVLRGPMGRDGVSVVDLALFASTDAVPVSKTTARLYVASLERAGYLMAGRGEPKLFRLKPDMNTGPKPPAIVQAKMVYDRNRGAIVGPFTAEEARS